MFSAILLHVVNLTSLQTSKQQSTCAALRLLSFDIILPPSIKEGVMQ